MNTRFLLGAMLAASLAFLAASADAAAAAADPVKISDPSIQLQRNQFLDQFAKFSATVSELISQRQYRQAQEVLRKWRTLLDGARPVLDEKQRLYSYARQQVKEAYLWESMGLSAYFLDGDYINAPTLIEKAQLAHERAARLLQKIHFPENAPADAVRLQHDMVAMESSEAQRTAGMKLLVEGDYESETANFERAIALLRQAQQALDQAQRQYPGRTVTDDDLAIMEEGRLKLNFIDFTSALLHRTLSDQALFRGDLRTAAEEQKARAKALERARTMHLRVHNELHDAFSKWFAREIHISNQRHDNLLAQARQRSKWAWIGALGFFVLALGSVVLFIWLSDRYALVRNRIVFALLLLFVMAVAGIGARQVAWKEAASWLQVGLGHLLNGK